MLISGRDPESKWRQGMLISGRDPESKSGKRGGESGNTLRIKQILLDCDHDAVLYLVVYGGVVCHTGRASCFFVEVTEVDKRLGPYGDWPVD